MGVAFLATCQFKTPLRYASLDRVKAKLLQDWLQFNSGNTYTLYSPNIVSMHPAGGRLDGSGNWAPNKAKWVKPEGTLDVSSDVLKKSISECDTDEKKRISNRRCK